MSEQETVNPLDDVFEQVTAGDFDEEYEESQIKPVPKGTYKLKIVEYRVRKCESEKNYDVPMVSFECDVIEDSDEELNGRKIFTQNFMIKPGTKAFFFFLDFATAVSPPNKFKKNTEIIGKGGKSTYLATFVGRTFVANVIVTDYEGKSRNEIQSIK